MSLDSPVPVTIRARVALTPPIVPLVSFTEVYPPKREKTKSASAAVLTDDIEGVEAVVLQAVVTFGSVENGSKGETVFAPDTAIEMPEADNGTVDNCTFIESE